MYTVLALALRRQKNRIFVTKLTSNHKVIFVTFSFCIFTYLHVYLFLVKNEKQPQDHK